VAGVPLKTDDVLGALDGPGVPIYDAANVVPDRPGLYAIHADAKVWRQLALGEPPDDRPLYVGKAEDSLVTRDLRTHFEDGRTGSSTLRRSFAALLHGPLKLAPQPRNPAKPERPANYGLPPAHDRRLTEWMQLNLRIAVWPSDGRAPLQQIEKRALDHWLPPLNLKDIQTPWTPQVKAARAQMAAQVRSAMKRAGLGVEEAEVR
jgi:hypothetical protein